MSEDNRNTTVVDSAEIEARPAATNASIREVRDLAADLWTKRKRLAELVEEGSKLEAEIELLEDKVIPDAMREVGVRLFELTNGFYIELEPFAHGSVKKEDEPQFFSWLERVKMAAIIKDTFTLTFGREEHKLANAFLASLLRRKKPIPFDRKEAIHASTLKAFFKERLEAEARGEVPPRLMIPRDLVNVHQGTKAVIVDPAVEAARKAKGRGGRKKAKEAVEL